MSNLEFIGFSIEHWDTILFWCFFFMALLFFLFYKLAPAKIYDPLNFYLSFNLGTGYGVFASLTQHGHIESNLFFLILFFGIVLIACFYYFLKHPLIFFPNSYKFFFKPIKSGKSEFLVVLTIYILLAILIVLNTGIGALADTNRFEQARGFGVFVRILDFFRLIILGYSALVLITTKSTFKKISIGCGLLIFLVFSSLLGGAKFGILEGLYGISVAVYSFGRKIKLNPITAVLILGFATIFALLIISLNERNNVEVKGVYNDESNILVQKLVARILANGDSYYGALPNNVIQDIKTDNVFIRFIAPVIGVSQTSKIVGYKVEDYSVGRAILLYHDPTNDVSGGPVSHFDLFSYKFFGWFGFIFIIFFVILLTSIVNALKKAPKNFFYIAVLSALWIRSLSVLLEPTVGLAYILDAFILIFFIKIVCYLFSKVSFNHKTIN